jgi:pyrimidine operon attenuation protein/uracil phosphoribosyltransferase
MRGRLSPPHPSGYDPPALAIPTLMDAARMSRTLSRIAHEILEQHPRVRSLALVGVRTRGVPLARRLARVIGETVGTEPPVGALDITLYRDDFTTLAPQPITRGSEILFSIDGRTVVLVDDVLFTGRTVRAALDQLIDFGRPARIELAVLVDRGHRELPIRADYVGRSLSTSREEVVQVLVREEDGRDEIVLTRRGRPRQAPTKAKAAAKKTKRTSATTTRRGAARGGRSRGTRAKTAKKKTTPTKRTRRRR